MMTTHSIHGTRFLRAGKFWMAFLLVLAMAMMPFSQALAADGDILPPGDRDWGHYPIATTYNGKTAVTAYLDSIPLDCATGMSNCQVQVRLVSKGTSIYSTWYEHPVQTIAVSGSSFRLTPRLACGTHYWKVQARIVYTSTKTATVNVYGEQEYKYGGGAVTLAKTIIFAGARAVTNLSFLYSQSMSSYQTGYTSWTDVDQAPGTITTGC